MDVIQSIATRVAVMDGGRVIANGDVFVQAVQFFGIWLARRVLGR